MERITARNPDGTVFLPKCFDKCDGAPDYSQCEECDEEHKLIERLAVIEDILGDDYDLSYLEGLFATLEEGSAVYCPIRPGDTVHVVDKDDQGIYYEPIQIKDVCANGFFMRDPNPDFRWGELGKTVFSSKKDAEAALAKMKEEGHGNL